MPIRLKQGQLTAIEKRIVKALLATNERNQDIQALVNLGRTHTVNSARITEVKQNNAIAPATEDEVLRFKWVKQSHDLETGLNIVEDERLVRAREAMVLAVQIFNSASLHFKSEVYLVLANVAWTYLLHDYYLRKNIAVIDKDGRSLLLGQMLKRNDCPLSKGQKNNLIAISWLRDEVEHKLLGKSDISWQGLFQACCLNFETVLCGLHGQKVSLSKNLAFALQFAKPSFHQLSEVSKYQLPENIQSLDARLEQMFSESDRLDLSYQFRVIYTLDSATKGNANFEFVRPDSSEGKDIRSVLVHYKTGDHLYPFKPGSVCQLVSKATKKQFHINHHTQAWLLYGARPKTKVKQPENTNKDFCIFHPAHRDYTYSQKWVDKLIEAVGKPDELKRIQSVRIA